MRIRLYGGHARIKAEQAPKPYLGFYRYNYPKLGFLRLLGVWRCRLHLSRHLQLSSSASQLAAARIASVRYQG